MAFLIYVSLITVPTPRAQGIEGPVIIAQFDVPVDAGSSQFMKSVVQRAINQKASAIVINMNTPGGLLSDMISIVSSVTDANQSGIPTYTYVVPNGLAASAGRSIWDLDAKLVLVPLSLLVVQLWSKIILNQQCLSFLSG